MSAQVDGVRAIAQDAAAGVGLVIENVSVSQAGRRRVVRIVVDLPDDEFGGVPLDSVAEASQAVSAALDASGLLGGRPYVLEVTSPGVDRPLTERRHWLRARRRLVAVRLADGGSTTGRLVAVDDDGIEVSTGAGPVRLGWDRVLRGAVEVEFGALDGDGDGDGELDDGPDPGDDRSGSRRRK
jgi:ribosome maturation factor RimP